MELSKKERVMLINQYKILKRLDETSSHHYDELIEILEHGYKTFYSTIEQSISEDMSIEKSKLVLNVLTIYRIIEDFKADNPNDTELKNHLFSFFDGFDGNNEAEYLLFTRFLIVKQKKFTEQLSYTDKNDNFNSHSRSVHRYKRMIAKWYQFEQSYDLSRTQIIEILKA